MPADIRFSDLLDAALMGWRERCSDEALFSLALPLQGTDPLDALPYLQEPDCFRWLLDCAPGLSLAASGRCQHLELAGSRRFELAQRFCDVTLGRLHDASPAAPAQARPRVLLAFSFFDQIREGLDPSDTVPAVQAVLPRWQLSRQGRRGWLRLNGTAQDSADIRVMVEQLWQKAWALERGERLPVDRSALTIVGRTTARPWQDCYRSALDQGLELVPARTDEPSLPPGEWMKKNLFSTPFNSLLTFVFLAIAIFAYRLAQELREHRVTAVAVTPGFLRSEKMLEH